MPNAKKSSANSGRYPVEQLREPEFDARFVRAGEAWDVALQIAALRREAGLSQKDLAKLLKTSQQSVSRLESPGYEGHSLSTLRRVAEVLHARIRVVFEPGEPKAVARIAETAVPYRALNPAASRLLAHKKSSRGLRQGSPRLSLEPPD